MAPAHAGEAQGAWLGAGPSTEQGLSLGDIREQSHGWVLWVIPRWNSPSLGDTRRVEPWGAFPLPGLYQESRVIGDSPSLDHTKIAKPWGGGKISPQPGNTNSVRGPHAGSYHVAEPMEGGLCGHSRPPYSPPHARGGA